MERFFYNIAVKIPHRTLIFKSAFYNNCTMNAPILHSFSVCLLVFWFKEPKLGSTAAGNETSEA